MPVRRDKDGNVIRSEDRTTIMPGRQRGRGEEKTEVAETPDNAARTRARPEPEERTRLNLGGVTPKGASDFMADPPVGWLVVVRGPGQGAAFALGIGENAVGRGGENRINLDFGRGNSDAEISRKRHTIVTYDRRHRKFYIRQGEGTNLTYMDDQPLLTPRELAGGEEFELGDTRLRFVRLCGPGFDWSAGAGEGDEGG